MINKLYQIISTLRDESLRMEEEKFIFLVSPSKTSTLSCENVSQLRIHWIPTSNMSESLERLMLTYRVVTVKALQSCCAQLPARLNASWKYMYERGACKILPKAQSSWARLPIQRQAEVNIDRGSWRISRKIMRCCVSSQAFEKTHSFKSTDENGGSTQWRSWIIS
jgi:hypothetical protein